MPNQDKAKDEKSLTRRLAEGAGSYLWAGTKIAGSLAFKAGKYAFSTNEVPAEKLGLVGKINIPKEIYGFNKKTISANNFYTVFADETFIENGIFSTNKYVQEKIESIDSDNRVISKPGYITLSNEKVQKQNIPSFKFNKDENGFAFKGTSKEFNKITDPEDISALNIVDNNLLKILLESSNENNKETKYPNMVNYIAPEPKKDDRGFIRKGFDVAKKNLPGVDNRKPALDFYTFNIKGHPYKFFENQLDANLHIPFNLNIVNIRGEKAILFSKKHAVCLNIEPNNKHQFVGFDENGEAIYKEIKLEANSKTNRFIKPEPKIVEVKEESKKAPVEAQKANQTKANAKNDSGLGWKVANVAIDIAKGSVGVLADSAVALYKFPYANYVPTVISDSVKSVKNAAVSMITAMAKNSADAVKSGANAGLVAANFVKNETIDAFNATKNAVQTTSNFVKNKFDDTKNFLFGKVEEGKKKVEEKIDEVKAANADNNVADTLANKNKEVKKPEVKQENKTPLWKRIVVSLLISVVALTGIGLIAIGIYYAVTAYKAKNAALSTTKQHVVQTTVSQTPVAMSANVRTNVLRNQTTGNSLAKA